MTTRNSKNLTDQGGICCGKICPPQRTSVLYFLNIVTSAICFKSQDILSVYSLPVCDNPALCQIACLTYDTLQGSSLWSIYLIYIQKLKPELSLESKNLIQFQKLKVMVKVMTLS